MRVPWKISISGIRDIRPHVDSTYGCTSVRLVRAACTSSTCRANFLGAFVTRAYGLDFYVVWGIAAVSPSVSPRARLGFAFLIPEAC